jgi:hypothetical protein
MRYEINAGEASPLCELTTPGGIWQVLNPGGTNSQDIFVIGGTKDSALSFVIPAVFSMFVQMIQL